MNNSPENNIPENNGNNIPAAIDWGAEYGRISCELTLAIIQDPMGNAVGQLEAQRQVIDAAWQLSLEQQAQAAFAGVVLPQPNDAENEPAAPGPQP
jgi:hypothetical protein